MCRKSKLNVGHGAARICVKEKPCRRRCHHYYLIVAFSYVQHRTNEHIWRREWDGKVITSGVGKEGRGVKSPPEMWKDTQQAYMTAEDWIVSCNTVFGRPLGQAYAIGNPSVRPSVRL